MISLQVYNVAHALGAFLLMTGLGAMAVLALSSNGSNGGARKLAAMAHGIGLLLILVAGFGQLARLSMSFTGWVWAKIVIWLVLGAAGFLMRRSPKLASLMLLLAPLLGGLAVWLGIFKP